MRRAIPLGIAAYAIAMMNIGGLFPRFMAPVVPLAMFVLVDLLFYWRIRYGWSRRRED